MSFNFQPLTILQDGLHQKKTAHLQIKANSVNWNIYLAEGKLQYAQHSLQSLETIKHHLMAIAPNAVTKIDLTKGQNNTDNLKLITIINDLWEQNHLNSSQKTTLIKELSQDALESFLWLREGEYQWNQITTVQSLKIKNKIGVNPLELSPLVKSLQIRLQLWQKLTPLITSPQQRPLFIYSSKLPEKVPNGSLSPQVLMQLAKLMQGATIRQLSIILKQDELKLAQLLFPYLQHQVIKLHSPKTPLDKLPTIPSVLNHQSQNNVSPKSSTSNTITTPIKINQTKDPLKSSQKNNRPINPKYFISNESKVSKSNKQKIYKIICIDDSPTILETIKDYLGNDKYEVLTVENPMQSLSYLFDSQPDLILMDLSMPGINGNRLTQILKSSSVFNNVPIIIVSGNTKMLDKEKVEAIGAKDFLAKPFTQESLLNIVNKYLQVTSQKAHLL
ncbi:response regulator [Geminocystis sp. GBBB08]|uniref:response regulator n=1 Tax=Geminocystis sp. GBBB08 TaxID=2604140 RepID=UPI0027E37149|nr:response regulator [Geminocystis sp. GBBB08]MBL1211181.1 response regulator [Geminocystis sp. GBBB08]